MNSEHVEVVKKGVAAIEEWRKKHPEQILDLIGVELTKVNLEKANLHKANIQRADLSEANLKKADLSESNLFESVLYGANLSQANLSRARISWGNLGRANLSGADLRKAQLVKTNFMRANLSGANCVGADLMRSDLAGANLSRTNFSRSSLVLASLVTPDFLETNLSNTDLSYAEIQFLESVNLKTATMNNSKLITCNLAKCTGLKTIKHKGPSFIDFDTLSISFREAGNRLTDDLEVFLLNAGIPRVLLETLPKILAEVKYCSAFVCYGQPDLNFAEKLVRDLKSRGVSCWLYSLDATPGERTWREITSRRREAEKMVVLCSAKALIRDGVLKEIEEQIDEEPDKIVPISLDDTWKQHGFLVKRAQRDLKPFLLERNYADFSDPSKYNQSLLRLLKGLKRN